MGMNTPPGRDARDLALGRILLALREGQLLDDAEHVDWWPTLDGHIDIGWEYGPFPFEVVAALARMSRDAELPDTTLVASDLQGVVCDPLDRFGPASVVVGGVRVRLRADRPVGRIAAAVSRG